MAPQGDRLSEGRAASVDGVRVKSLVCLRATEIGKGPLLRRQ